MQEYTFSLTRIFSYNAKIRVKENSYSDIIYAIFIRKERHCRCVSVDFATFFITIILQNIWRKWPLSSQTVTMNIRSKENIVKVCHFWFVNICISYKQFEILRNKHSKKTAKQTNTLESMQNFLNLFFSLLSYRSLQIKFVNLVSLTWMNIYIHIYIHIYIYIYIW